MINLRLTANSPKLDSKKASTEVGSNPEDFAALFSVPVLALAIEVKAETPKPNGRSSAEPEQLRSESVFSENGEAGAIGSLHSAQQPAPKAPRQPVSAENGNKGSRNSSTHLAITTALTASSQMSNPPFDDFHAVKTDTAYSVEAAPLTELRISNATHRAEPITTASNVITGVNSFANPVNHPATGTTHFSPTLPINPRERGQALSQPAASAQIPAKQLTVVPSIGGESHVRDQAIDAADPSGKQVNFEEGSQTRGQVAAKTQKSDSQGLVPSPPEQEPVLEKSDIASIRVLKSPTLTPKIVTEDNYTPDYPALGPATKATPSSWTKPINYHEGGQDLRQLETGAQRSDGQSEKRVPSADEINPLTGRLNIATRPAESLPPVLNIVTAANLRDGELTDLANRATPFTSVKQIIDCEESGLETREQSSDGRSEKLVPYMDETKPPTGRMTIATRLLGFPPTAPNIVTAANPPYRQITNVATRAAAVAPAKQDVNYKEGGKDLRQLETGAQRSDSGSERLVPSPDTTKPLTGRLNIVSTPLEGEAVTPVPNIVTAANSPHSRITTPFTPVKQDVNYKEGGPDLRQLATGVRRSEGQPEADQNASEKIVETLLHPIIKEHSIVEKTAAGDNFSDRVVEQLQTAVTEMLNISRTGNEKRSLKIRLNPAELGVVEITIERSSTGRITAHFQTEHESTRQMLQQGLEQLRNSLESTGSQVGDLKISSGSSPPSGNETSGNKPQSFAPSESRSHETAGPEGILTTEDDSRNHLVNLRA